MAWLKTFHPREFYDAYLSLELAADNPDYILVRRLGIEARNAGIIKDAVPLFPTIQEPIRFVGDKIIGGFPGFRI